MRLQYMLIRSVVILILTLFLQYAQAQTVFYARVIPGETRYAWVIGRNLWVGNEHAYHAQANRVSLTINGTPCRWDLLRGGNDQEPNRTWPYAQRFTIPETIEPGDYPIEHTRNDGTKTQATIHVPACRGIGDRPLVLTGVTEIDGPISVNPGQVLDLGGKTIIPSAKYVGGESLVTLGDGASLGNGGVYIPEGSRTNVRDAVRLVGGQHTIANINVANMREGGYGVFVDDSYGSHFVRVNVCAQRTWENNPGDRAQSNTWYQCDNRGHRLGRDSQIGRGICGANNLIVNCSWHDIDRGPTGSQYGSPMDRMVFYECHQWNTGRHILGEGLRDAGSSEGLLIETASNYLGVCSCGNDQVIVTNYTAQADPFIKPGYHVCLMEPKVWARIKAVNFSASAPSVRVLTIDRMVPSGQFLCRIGNAVCECSFLRCQFENGRSGIWLHGASLETAIIQCDFIGLRHAGIVKLERDLPGMQCFHWGLQTKYLNQWGTEQLIRDYSP